MSADSTQPSLTNVQDMAPPVQRVGRRAREHRRQLMSEEFEQIALDLFVERGYASVSVEEVAEAAGVTARTFYRYFTGKEDVLALYPRRLSDRVRDALKEESPDRSLFDAFSSVLVKLAASLDVEELRRWWAVVSSDPYPLRSMALNMLDLRRDMEPEFAAWISDDPESSMHFDLVLAAGQAAMITGTMSWYCHGGDLATWVEKALGVYARGFSGPQGSRRKH
jgi:TetR/AcrR family transcriptional regulator, regulator of mycofactocin system